MPVNIPFNLITLENDFKSVKSLGVKDCVISVRVFVGLLVLQGGENEAVCEGGWGKHEYAAAQCPKKRRQF